MKKPTWLAHVARTQGSLQPTANEELMCFIQPPNKELNPANNSISELGCGLFPIQALRCIMDWMFVSSQSSYVDLLILYEMVLGGN